MKFKEWHKVAYNKEVGRAEDGNIEVTRLPDWDYVVRYRKVPNQPGKEWNWLVDPAGNKREFTTPDEALEAAMKYRGELLSHSAGLTDGHA
jgi:hypothetical protein